GLQGVDGRSFVVGVYNLDPNPQRQGETLEGLVPLFVAQEREGDRLGWAEANITNLMVARDKQSVVYIFWQKLSDDKYTSNVLRVANKIRIGAELFNSNIYNQNFDWKKVLVNWDEVNDQIRNGKIPFDTEIFDKVWLDRTDRLLSFAKRHKLPVAGSGFLFWSSDIPEFIYKGGFAPEERRKLFEFMAKAKVLRFREQITEWTVTSEIAASELWGPDQFKQLYRQLGSRKFISDLFFWAREINPESRLVLAEDHILDVNNDAHRQLSTRFFELLADLKQYGTPIDAIDLENNFWIYAPPNREEMIMKLKQLQEMGFSIAAPETIIAVSEVWPLWKERPRTVNSIANETLAQAQIAADMTSAYLKVNGEIGFFSGTDYITWFNEIGHPEATPEILDDKMQPKAAYYAVLSEILRYLLQSQ
ncbi:MAG: endo-1,4-beta-xylanase, partial [Methanothermobacter tenebrarum]